MRWLRDTNVSVLTATLLALFVVWVEGATCPQGWLQFGDHCYFFSTSNYAFETARSICQSREGDLVTINSVEERIWIDGIVRATQMNTWIGAVRDPDNKDNWNWVDNSSPSPTDDPIAHWRPDQPSDDTDKNCVQIYSKDFKWMNEPCTWRRAYICKRRNDVHDVCDVEGNWHAFDTHCYKYFEELRDWNDASATCQANKGDLVVLETQAKWRILSDVIGCTDYEKGIWLGLSDTSSPGEYKWVDGQSLTQNNWDQNMPPSAGGSDGDNCAFAFPLNGYKWRVSSCGVENHFSCMRAQSTCYPDWLDYNTGACYQYYSLDSGTSLSWSDAERFCNEVAQGGRLMKVESQAQQNALKDIASKLLDAGISRVRIGLSDKYFDNIFEWSDKSRPTYTNWGTLNPVNNRWDCVYASTIDYDAKWNTGYCFTSEAFICQVPAFADPGPVSPPPVLWQCDDGWITDQRKGDCYLVGSDEDRIDFAQAVSKCVSQTATIISIRDEHDQSFITSIMRQSTFLGLEYNSGRSRYEWTDQSPMTFQNWDSQDDPSVNQVARMVMSLNIGSWVSESRSTQRNYICRKKAVSTTATPTTPAPTPPWSSRCGQGWSHDTLGGSCYQINNQEMSWADSRAYCQQLDSEGDLASITGANDQVFLNAMLATTSIAGSRVFWTGGNDIDQSSGWKWTDGSPFAYLNWYDGEPNDYTGKEWCIEMTHTGDRNGRWFDHDCDTAYKSICKKPSSDREPTPTVAPTQPPVVCTNPEPLLSWRHYIQDASFYATSAQTGREAFKSRLDSTVVGIGGGWSAEASDQTPHLSISFHSPVHAITIITQGAQDKDEWVTEYRVSYRLTSSEQYIWARDDNGDIIAFPGNSDRNTKVENALTSFGILVTTIRIYPQLYSGGVSMRLEITGCKYGECGGKERLVSGESMVPDERMTASGSWDERHAPQRARIHTVASDGLGFGAWVSDQPWTNQKWIQVEFDVYMTVLAIETLGREDNAQWTGSYKVLFSGDGLTWETYQDPFGTDKVFTGNYNQHTLVVNELYAPMRCKFVRINPQTWNSGVALRLEILGCRSRDCAANSLISGDNHYLDENRLSASSSLDANHGPGRSRLHQQPSGSQAGGWVPQFQDDKQYIQVDLGYEIEIVGVATQGQHGLPNYITEYYVSHSRDMETWYNHSDTGNGVLTLYSGNLDETKARKHYFDRGFRARGVRVHPTKWTNNIAVRWEVYGCPGYGSMKYMGCFNDAEDRDLPYALVSNPPGGMTREFCSLHCFNNDYSYAGTQYSVQCWCGNSYGKYGISSECKSSCNGKPTETCGGYWATDITYTGISAMYDRCQDGWVAFGNDCYKFILDSTTWIDAEYNCRYLAPNTHLATINSVEQQQFIDSQLAIYQTRFWIGLHCRRNNYQFEWVNGETVRHTNWNRREPNDASQTGEDCVMIYSNGKWNDDPCDNRRSNAYICQQPKQNLPNEPTPAPDPGCGDNWVNYRWKCFAFITARHDWNNAKSTCEAMGGNLARVEDAYEQAFLSSQLTDRYATSYYWTDLSNQGQGDGLFRFTNGNSPTSTFWATGRPESIEEPSCVAMHSTDHGTWHNLHCVDSLHYICEKPHADVSRPTGQPTLPPEGQCANGWKPLGTNDCIEVNNPSANFHRNWYDALADCQSKGADLVSIHSEDINNQALAQVIGETYGFWMGLNSLDGEGFKWSDGTPVEFFNWNAPDQPGSDPSENCVEMMPQSTGKWSTTTCNANKPWMCKIRRGASVSPTTTLSLPTAGPPGSCQPDSDDWKMYNGRCYFFSPLSPSAVRGELDWWAAQAFCNSYDANLASIHNVEDNNFIMGQVKTVENIDLWVGLNRLTPGSGWNWIDGSPANYRNWGEGQPDNAGGQEACATMVVAHDKMGSWNDKHCQNQLGFICVKNPGGPTIPTVEPTIAPGNCPDGWLGFKSKCYKFYEDENVDWTTAVSRCKADVPEPWSLATFQNIWEMYFMISHLRHRHRVYWIGLHQFNGGDGEFGWIDNSPVSYTNWNGGEPNGGSNEGCVEMYTGPFNAGKWNDIACSALLPFICMQYKSTSNPSPPTTANPCADSDYIEYEGNCYKIASNTRNWQEAEDHCQEDTNSHLASLHSIYEQAFVSYSFHDRDRNIWLGLTDQQDKGRYYWSDGSAVQYTNWHPSQPDMTTPGCTYLSHNDDAMWFDDECDQSWMAMCEIYQEPPPFTRPPGGLCPASTEGVDWIEYGYHCYYFQMDNPVTFGDAQTECTRLGAHLATVHSEEENDFIVAHSISQTLHWVWLGLIRTQEGGWSWLDGEPLVFTNWNTGEPGDGSNGENCGELYPTVGNGLWNDVSCTITNDFVCKVRMIRDPGETVPMTSPPTLPPSSNPTPTSTRTQPASTTIGVPGSSQASTKLPPITPPVGINPGNGGLSPGETAGVVFGVFIAVLVVGFLGFIVYRRQLALGVQSGANGSEGVDNPVYNSQGGVSFGATNA